jgi:hypothetical protein
MSASGVKKERGHMKKRRLITFGDSFTFGHYLPDPDTQAWPSLLANMLDLELINKADPGSSNIEILISILTFDFKENDLVVVGWTFIERDMIFRKKSLINRLFNRHENTRVQVWSENPETKLWIALHPEFDQAVRSGLHIHHAELYLNSLSLEQFHIFTQPPNTFRYRNSFPVFFKNITNLLDRSIFSRVDLALDNSHPGVKSHQNTANNIYKVIHDTK